MNFKVPNPILLFGICVYAGLVFFSACGSHQKLVANASIKAPTLTYTMPLYLQPQTTIDTTPKRMSEKQIRELLSSSYRLSFDELLSPEFRKLNYIIAKQATVLEAISASNHKLATIIVDMRARSIKRLDSTNLVIARERESRAKLEKVYLDAQRNQVERNAKQISFLKDLTNILLVVCFIMIISKLLLLIAVRILWKKMNTLYKQINNA